MPTKIFDIHQAITDKIVAAIEAGAGDFVMPWHRKKGGLKPRNVLTGNFYQGVNILALWVEAQANGYSSNLWRTYRQWSERGAQVRKGAKSSFQVIIPTDDDHEQIRPVAKATPVFNVDQGDNSSDPEPIVLQDAEPVITLLDVDAFISSTGAQIEHGGDHACNSPSADTIDIPSLVSQLTSPDEGQLPFMSVTLEQFIEVLAKVGTAGHARALHRRYCIGG